MADGFRRWSKDKGSRVVLVLVLYLLVYGAWQIFRWGGPANKQLIGDVAFWPVNLAAVAFSWRVARRRDLEQRVRRAWWLIGGGLLAVLLGDFLQFLNENVFHVTPYPSFANVTFLAFYPLVLAGIIQFPRNPTTRSTSVRSLLDGINLVLAGGAVIWFVLLAPSALARGQNPLQLVFSIAYPCGDLVLIFGLAKLVISKSRSFRGRPLYFFASGLVSFVVADLIYGHLSLTYSYSGGDPVDTIWVVALVLFALSASEYSRTATALSQPERVHLEPADTSMFAYVAVAVSFSLMVMTIVHEGLLAIGAVSIASASSVAVLTRLHWSSVSKRRQERYYRALVERVSGYIIVLDVDFVPRYVSPPLLHLLDVPTDAIVSELSISSLVLEEDRPLMLASLERAGSAPETEARFELQMRDREGQVRHVFGVVTNLLDDRDVEGLVVVLHDFTEKVLLEQELRNQALHDALTGLPNRALIYDRLTQMLVASRRRGSRVAVLYVDLDDFKDVNDSLGHGAGDELLRVVARRLDSLVRGQDTVGRIGGDEFVLIADVTDEPETATLLAQRILDVMVEPIELESVPGRPLSIRASIGIVVGDSGTPDEVLRHADLALYRAKAISKNCFVVFEPEMYTLLAERLELESDLSDALANHEFFLVYQPVIDLKTFVPKGVEALVRWQHPRRGVVSPLDFIPLLEQRGLMVEAGQWILNQACVQGARWQREGRPLTVSVNASAVQLMDENFVEIVCQALNSSHLDPDRLVIEITESVLLRDSEKIIAVLTALKQLGVQIAVDDFGTGYSSFSYLRQFPIDILKIDQSFIADMNQSKEAATIVRTLVHLGDELGIDTVAEGIEDPNQLTALRDGSCDFGQGYFIARPMSPEAIPMFLDTWQHAQAVS